jgi:hypothetical protein
MSVKMIPDPDYVTREIKTDPARKRQLWLLTV